MSTRTCTYGPGRRANRKYILNLCATKALDRFIELPYSILVYIYHINNIYFLQ